MNDSTLAPRAETVGRTGLGAPLLTADEVATYLRCSVEMVYKLRRTGRLRAVKVGALYRFRPEAVRALVGAEGEGR